MRSSGSRWVWTAATPGLSQIAPLDALCDLCRGPELEIGGELQVQGDVERASLFEDRDVVGLHHQRLGEGDRKHPIAQVQPAAARLDVDHHVAAGERRLDRRLDQVGRLMALDHRLTGRHRDDDVGEVAPRRLAQAQPAQLDVRPQLGDRPLGCFARLLRSAVHQHVRVLGDQAHRGRADDRRDDQRGRPNRPR